MNEKFKIYLNEDGEIEFNLEILENSFSILYESMDILKELINSENLSEDEKEKIKTILENFIIINEDNSEELNELRKIVFRNGIKKVIKKKRMKGMEKLHRKMAAKKAARKRKGKKRKATSILKLKKSLRMRHKVMK